MIVAAGLQAVSENVNEMSKEAIGSRRVVILCPRIGKRALDWLKARLGPDRLILRMIRSEDQVDLCAQSGGSARFFGEKILTLTAQVS